MTGTILRAIVLLAAVALSAVCSLPAAARPAPDSLRLEQVRAAAAATDPRSVQPELMERVTRFRIEALRAAFLPQFSIGAEASIQNDVPEIGAELPGDPLDISIPRRQYRAEVQAEWSVYDGGVRRRQAAAERARLDEQVVGVEAALYPVREAATEAFFGILLMDAQQRALELAAEELAARLAISQARAREGATLEAEAAVVEAELIRVQQQVEEVAANRRAAVRTLADVTGMPIEPDTPVALPDLSGAWTQTAGPVLPEARRPELRRITAQADRVRAEARTLAARTRPTLSLFGRAGVGRPSPLDFLSDAVQDFAVAGVRLRWAAFDWGRTRREVAAARLQADILETERAALDRRFGRDALAEREHVVRLERALDDDARAVSLREVAADVAARQVDEGVLLVDSYTARINDLAAARLTRERHRIELARARARVISALGLFPPDADAPRPDAVHPPTP